MELKKTKVIFFGTPFFSKEILASLFQNVSISLVVTQPARPSGRKKIPKESEVKKFAISKGLNVLECDKITTEIFQLLKNQKPDMIITAAYGSIFAESVLELPKFGALNVHPSLLPKYRGPSPIQYALLNGETKTGTTIMLMDKGMDSGDILRQVTIPIEPQCNYPFLEKKLIEKSIEILLPTIQSWLEKKIEPKKQTGSKASFSKMIKREDGLIDWSKSSSKIFNMHRAFFLWPKTFSFFNDERGKKKLIFHEIEAVKENPESQPGKVLFFEEKIAIATSNGLIIPNVVQLEGKSPLPIDQFILGKKSFIGSILG